MIDLDDYDTIDFDSRRVVRDRTVVALGRLDGTIANLNSGAGAIFAQRVVTDCVIDALRIERHAFTDHGFAIWRAGIATLTGEETNRQRSPGRIMTAVLSELGSHEWQPLAEAAQGFGTIARPVRDARRIEDDSDPVDDLWQASDLAKRVKLGKGSSNLALDYADAAREHVVFAPRESQLRTFGDGAYRRAYRLLPIGPPTWALSLYAGFVLKSDGVLRHALPLPGSIMAHSLRADVDETERVSDHLAALERSARQLTRIAEVATRADRAIRERCSGLRSTSRASALASLLAGFGAMRSDQLERLIGATRVGVHGMLVSLREIGLATTTQASGVKLHSFVADGPSQSNDGVRQRETFSRSALDEFDAAMTAVDELLSQDDRAISSTSNELSKR